MNRKRLFGSEIPYTDNDTWISCDGKCDKAFGLAERPISENSLAEGDFEWLADDEVGDAPEVSCHTIDGENKPQLITELHNKWCIVHCERSILMTLGQEATLPNFDKRVPNIPKQ